MVNFDILNNYKLDSNYRFLILIINFVIHINYMEKKINIKKTLDL